MGKKYKRNLKGKKLKGKEIGIIGIINIYDLEKIILIILISFHKNIIN